MAGENASGERRVRRRRPNKAKLADDFYGSALDAAERIELEAASEVTGLDEEIAVLRTKLRSALAEAKEPKDIALLLRGIDLLVKAVVAKYRLSPKEGDDLSTNIEKVLRGAGELLIPEAFRDG